VSLALRAAEVGGPLRWRWLLSDAETGVPVADHRVDLDAESADLAAFRAVTGSAGSAVSLVTPGVFGVRAAGLRLAVPRGSPQLDPAEAAMAYFPDEPERFVDRAAAMAGAGKTACALELAYRHQDSFAAAAFWQAPTKEDEFAGALGNLAARLNTQLGDFGFAMAGHVGTVASLEAFLPRLRRVLDDAGVLLVLDNLETLLTSDGMWRDPRWEPLITALTGHGGESRLIMTSRVPPAGLGPGVLVLPVHALPLAEAVALARELPNLRALLHAADDPAGPVRADADADADRERVRRVRLDTQLAAAEAAAAGEGPDAFFRDGTSTLDPGQFLTALSGWTTRALAVLPPAARLPSP